MDRIGFVPKAERRALVCAQAIQGLSVPQGNAFTTLHTNRRAVKHARFIAECIRGGHFRLRRRRVVQVLFEGHVHQQPFPHAVRQGGRRV